jgi:hypothetical protein
MIETIKYEMSEYIGSWFITYLRSLNKIIKYTKGNINFHVLVNGNGNGNGNGNDNGNDKEIIIKNLNRIHKFSNNAKIDVYISLSPYKKEFDKTPKLPLSRFNINSGFTFKNINRLIPIDKKIYILRKEEFGKVIFHEYIHHILEIDNSFSSMNIKRLQQHFNIKSDIDPNETIVEFWATIMFLQQISEETKKDFYELFKEELKYSLYKSYQLFELQKKNNGIWFDNTNAYCYIIFKTIIMYNLQEFQKIYTFPYEDTKITDFLIKYSNSLPQVKSNPTKRRPDNSLCFMVNSDN